MKVELFLKKAGITEYHLNAANEKEESELVGLYQFVNSEIERVKTECAEFYHKLNYSDVDINRQVNKALHSLYPSIYRTLKLNGWFFRLGQWQRKYKEDYEKILNEAANVDEEIKWKKLKHFFDTHRIPKEFRVRNRENKTKRAI